MSGAGFLAADPERLERRREAARALEAWRIGLFLGETGAARRIGITRDRYLWLEAAELACDRGTVDAIEAATGVLFPIETDVNADPAGRSPPAAAAPPLSGAAGGGAGDGGAGRISAAVTIEGAVGTSEIGAERNDQVRVRWGGAVVLLHPDAAGWLGVQLIEQAALARSITGVKPREILILTPEEAPAWERKA